MPSTPGSASGPLLAPTPSTGSRSGRPGQKKKKGRPKRVYATGDSMSSPMPQQPPQPRSNPPGQLTQSTPADPAQAPTEARAPTPTPVAEPEPKAASSGWGFGGIANMFARKGDMKLDSGLTCVSIYRCSLRLACTVHRGHNPVPLVDTTSSATAVVHARVLLFSCAGALYIVLAYQLNTVYVEATQALPCVR